MQYRKKWGHELFLRELILESKDEEATENVIFAR